jgi:phosphoglycolate phosphatase
MIDAVLFDLDGTLADTAPDLGGALNHLRSHRGLDPLPIDVLRPHASSGARGMIGVGLGITPGHDEYDALKTAFLEHYENNLLVHSRLFDGVRELLAALEASELAWGIVTNKATRYAEPLVEGIGLRPTRGCVICGDTTPHAKPHPEPLLEAARRLDLVPARCVYVGDDERDILAARAAGMRAVAAGYGYLGTARGPAEWGADTVIDHPKALLQWLSAAIPVG